VVEDKDAVGLPAPASAAGVINQEQGSGYIFSIGTLSPVPHTMGDDAESASRSMEVTVSRSSPTICDRSTLGPRGNRRSAMPLLAIGIGGVLLAACGDPNVQVQRHQVDEGFDLTKDLRIPVAEFHQKYGRMPRDNNEAGLVPPEVISGRYVSRVTVLESGGFEVTWSSKSPQHADPALDGATLRFVPTPTAPGRFDWTCASDTLPAQACPQTCSCTRK
jgi:hypothetical protein